MPLWNWRKTATWQVTLLGWKLKFHGRPPVGRRRHCTQNSVVWKRGQYINIQILDNVKVRSEALDNNIDTCTLCGVPSVNEPSLQVPLVEPL